MGDDADGEGELAVLVCTANVGNAAPTPESFRAWVPDDGDVAGPVAGTKYAVAADGADEARASLSAGRKFDVVVLGMQEAAFSEPRGKMGGDAVPAMHLDASSRLSAAMKEQGRKSKKGLVRRIKALQLLSRGLGMTTAENYQA